MKTILPITLTTIALGACGYLCYKWYKRRKPVSDDFDHNEMQRVNTLYLEKVLVWIRAELEKPEFENKKFEVGILPNSLTLEAFKDKLQLSKRDLKKCHFIYIKEKESEKIVAHKLIIAANVAEELSVINDKVYVIPVE